MIIHYFQCSLKCASVILTITRISIRYSFLIDWRSSSPADISVDFVLESPPIRCVPLSRRAIVDITVQWYVIVCSLLTDLAFFRYFILPCKFTIINSASYDGPLRLSVLHVVTSCLHWTRCCPLLVILSTEYVGSGHFLPPLCPVIVYRFKYQTHTDKHRLSLQVPYSS